MTIIRTRKEFEDLYYYKDSKIPEDQYPIHYPCIVEQVANDNGWYGHHIIHLKTYIPDSMSEISFVLGYMAGKKTNL